MSTLLKETKPTSSELMYKQIYQEFEDFVIEKSHPCVMAQTVFSMDQVSLNTYSKLGSIDSACQIISDLKDYIEDYDFESNDFYTFIAVFKGTQNYTEEEFEKALWEQLRLINKVDDKDWDPEVSADPESNKFSFSIAGKAFYVVGMHPGSSRMARQTPYPAIAFNLHCQFEKLREMGSYEVVKNRIRDRDRALQGTINPMLENFGKDSEAKQYSGRKVDEKWKCPFHQGNN